MIGIGKWKFSVKTFIYSGEVTADIFDNGGKYGYKLEVPGVAVPEIKVKEVKEEGNTVDVTFSTPVLPGKDILIHAEFSGDTFTGYAKIPLFGKIKLSDGHLIA